MRTKNKKSRSDKLPRYSICEECGNPKPTTRCSRCRNCSNKENAEKQRGVKRGPNSQEHNLNISKAKTGPGHHFYGKHLSEESRKKQSESMKGHPSLTKPKSEAHKRKLAIASTGQKKSPEALEKFSISMKRHYANMTLEEKKVRSAAISQGQKNMTPEAKIKRFTSMLISLNRHPNKFEQRVIDYLQTNQFPFRFTGDGSFWVHPCKSGKHRNPDFIHSDGKTKKIILAHGTYWHSDEVEVNIELNDYKDRGWECFIIWEHDKLDVALSNRVRKFVNQ